MQLRFSNNSIIGALAGKPIHCVVRLSQGTGSLAPGEYSIPPPDSNPLFGQTALVVPLKVGGTPVANAGGIKNKFGPTGVRLAARQFKHVESTAGAGASEVLVLSDKPIAGTNCLIVSLGFGELMLGLEASGGATLTVS